MSPESASEAPLPMSHSEVTDRYFLEMRCRVLDLAAALDRLDRAQGAANGDPRLARLREAITILSSDELGRAERVQLAFSREYDPGWRSTNG